MDEKMILDKLTKIVRDVTGDDDIVVDKEANFIDDLDIMSIELFQMIIQVEDEFGISIPDTVVGDFVTVKDIVDFIGNKVNN